MIPPFEITSLSIQLLANIERLLGHYEGLPLMMAMAELGDCGTR
jgi:hypothetical protein